MKSSNVINVDENSPEFRAHIARRAQEATDPKNRLPLSELKKQLEQRRKQLVGKKMRPNKPIRLVLWICGYKWRPMAVYATFKGNEKLIVIGRKML
jgi:hypothetical protein